jgi:hypothetical protein
LDPSLILDELPVIRLPASKLLREGEMERSIELAARKTRGQGGILILLDCDDGCPAEDGPALLQRALKARSDLPISVVLAKREFEAWFLASAESLRGHRSLSFRLATPEDPEEIRGAKEWLTDRMPAGRSYSESSDQPALAAVFDMESARRANSFDKCYREIVRLIERVRQAAA